MPAKGTTIPEDILTIREVADYLKVTERTLYRLVKDGELPAFKVGNSWRFRREDISAWIGTQTTSRRGGGRSRE